MEVTTSKLVRPCTPIDRACITTATPKSISDQTLAVKTRRKLERLFLETSNQPEQPKWMEYQGIRNWEGLLDPLDGNLRQEIIRYGHFVEAAYQSCDFDPSSITYGMSKFPKKRLLEDSGFSGTGYKVTKNLTATSGIKLPNWITEKARPMRSSWIGYITVCQDRRKIAGIGRRDVVIALRGTATIFEWLENLRANLTPVTGEVTGKEPASMVESGFLSLYTSGVGNVPSLQTLVREEIGRILETYGDEPLSFTFTGHSLGAALATLAAYDIKKTFKNSPLVTVVSFAGPRVGDCRFRRQLEQQGTKILRIVNPNDMITKVPGFVVENNDAAVNFGGWVNKLIEDTQWVYADVGCELRLRNEDTTYRNGFDIATCHDLKTYLQLVNGFVGSRCPLRATARRMMKMEKKYADNLI